jgi:hypothetical protein
VVRQALRRFVDVAVLFFAGLGFVYVPLGKKTGLEHVRSLLRTPEARDLTTGVADALGSVRGRVLDEVTADPRPTGSVEQRSPKANSRSEPRSRVLDVPVPALHAAVPREGALAPTGSSLQASPPVREAAGLCRRPAPRIWGAPDSPR